MKDSYYILTVLRNGEYDTIVGELNLVKFILIEKELGNNTFIIHSVEISQHEYNFYINRRK